MDANSPAEIAGGHCEQARHPFAARFPGLKFIKQLGNGYESNYSGLQATLTQRTSHGLSYLLGYTYSHAFDQASDNRAPQAMDSTNPAREYGSSHFDIHHRLTLAVTYAVPGTRSWGQLLQGWQLNSIVTVQTGQPWNVVDTGNDISLTGEGADRLELVRQSRRLQPLAFRRNPVLPGRHPECCLRSTRFRDSTATIRLLRQRRQRHDSRRFGHLRQHAPQSLPRPRTRCLGSVRSQRLEDCRKGQTPIACRVLQRAQPSELRQPVRSKFHLWPRRPLKPRAVRLRLRNARRSRTPIP